jgi:hypothetical protein
MLGVSTEFKIDDTSVGCLFSIKIASATQNFNERKCLDDPSLQKKYDSTDYDYDNTTVTLRPTKAQYAALVGFFDGEEHVISATNANYGWSWSVGAVLVSFPLNVSGRADDITTEATFKIIDDTHPWLFTVGS